MYRRMLFAVDDDEALPGAVPVVTAYARRWNAAVRVLHVHRIDPEMTSGPGRRLVTQLVERLQADGIDAAGEVRLIDGPDRLAGVIAHVAEREETDLVAIGSHGRSDLGALFLGSVSHAVAAGLVCPVLVIRSGCAGAEEPRRVLVAVDGSAGSDLAVADAAEVAEAFGAEAVVLHVRELVAAEGSSIVEPAETGRAIVQRGLATMEARGIPATGQNVIAISVDAGIAQVVERLGADLVVLGSRRPSDVGGLLLGSVGHAMVHKLRCPVLLARRQEARARVTKASAPAAR